MSEVLELQRHEDAGFELPIPAGWEVVRDREGCALIAVELPRAEPHLRASIVVTLELLEDEGWEDRSLAALRESLNRLRVIDDEPVEVGGVAGRRVLSHYVHRAFGGVNLEQWLVRRGDRGYVVSCSTAALEYDDLWDLMTAAGEGLRLT
jgi:hypothetical protein